MISPDTLPKRLGRILTWLEQKAAALAIASCLIVGVLLSAAALIKYAWSGYNGLDLAIFTQVVSETARGNLFGLTIHPHAYLGDHVELILLLIAPLAHVFATAPLLLVAQSLALAAGGLAAFRIGRRLLGPLSGVVVALAYLFNPIVLNAALFEFHALTLAIPLLLWAVEAYLAGRFVRYLILVALALAVREDVSLAIAGLGLVAAMDRRRWPWIAVPIALGIGWFVAAQAIAANVSDYGEYKFLQYYGWLGDSWPAILRTLALHPLRWLPDVLSVQTLALIVGAFGPLLFLPLFRGRWLVPLAPIVLQLILLRTNALTILQIHYAALLVPWLIVAATAGLGALPTSRFRRVRRLAPWRPALIAVLLPAALYFSAAIGPLWSAPRTLAAGADQTDLALQRTFERMVPNDAALATTFGPMARLAERPRLYSLNYVFLGRRQFSETPYGLPDDVDTILIDLDDLVHFDLLYPDDVFRGQTGADRIREVLDRGFRLVAWEDHYALWQRGTGGQSLVERAPLNQPVANALAIGPHLRYLGLEGSSRLRATEPEVADLNFSVLPAELRWTAAEPAPDDYELSFRLYREGQRVYERLYPLGNGLYPTSQWRPNELVTTRYRFRLPANLAPGNYEARVAVGDVSTQVGLSGLRSIEYEVTFRELSEIVVDAIDIPPSRAAVTHNRDSRADTR